MYMSKSLNEQRDKEKLINKIRQSKEQKDVSTLWFKIAETIYFAFLIYQKK
ncbi:hypothetical protein [Enterococcus faecium]|uniref:Uncharacterized protein n=1 Tax=Enterococcus faecium TaxID=1352 RepID=A0A242AT57_ENTFC|nr:hypothetical protein [Enterococcus faecium]OTN83798.1 hypothetical protein A5810_003087 [Enterococcus faecium]